MNKFYIADLEGKSGIHRYSKAFFAKVLSVRGYQHISCKTPLSEILQVVQAKDEIYMEIGVNLHTEISVLYELLNHGFDNVSVTLHDPPYIRYPYFKFKSKLLNNASKVFQIYFNNFGIGHSVYGKIKHIYVLNKRAVDLVKQRFKVDNVRYMPLVIAEDDVQQFNALQPVNHNLLFFGFIWKKKGIEYALDVHEKLLETIPDAQFYVIGEAISKEGQDFFDKIKSRYNKNVHYLGFVKENDLDSVFAKASSVILPFSEYGVISPTSASTLNALARGKLLFVTPVNSLPELITNGENGYFLTRDLQKDVDMIVKVMNDPDLMRKVQKRSLEMILENNSPGVVGKYFDTAR